MANFTDNQLKVIRHRGGNLLVSAGAGSGKTTTMTERIVSLLRGDNGQESIHLSNLIVLTFTNEAAKNIKEKIIEELSGNENLKEELDHIEEADISTFDSFCHKLVKKYSSKSELSQNFTIGDDNFFEVKANTFINEILDGYYKNSIYQNDVFNKENNDDIFFKVLETKTNGKQDNSLVKTLGEYYKAINNEIDVDQYLNTYMDIYFSREYARKLLHVSVQYIRELVETALKLDVLDRNNVIENNNINKVELFIESTLRQFNEFLSIKDDSQAFIKYKTFKKEGGVGDKTIKDGYKEDYSKQFEFINNNIFKNADNTDNKKNKNNNGLFYSVFINMNLYSLDPISAFEKAININKDYYQFINDVMIELHKKMSAFKKEFSIYQFNDIEKEAIRILENNPDIRDYYKKNIKEIIIDEYQDTNDVQSYLISLIANNNEVVVGDIKQSIYGFRNANPEIFNNRANEYQHDSNKGTLVSMKENFRSRKEEVLDEVNKVFINKASNKICDMPYFSDSLEYGNKKLYDSNNDAINNKFRIIKYYGPEDGGASAARAFSREIIAKDIKLRLSKELNQQAFHKTKDETGKSDFVYEVAKEKDFLILGRTNGVFKTLKKTLEEYKLASLLPNSLSFIRSEEIIFIKNSIILIDLISLNETDKVEFMVSLASILRSFVIQASDNEIGKMMALSKKTNNIQAFENCFNNIYKVYRNSADEYKSKGIYSSLITLINSNEIRLYEKLSHLVKTESRENKINYFLNQINSYAKTGLTPSEVIEYLNHISSNEDDDLNVSLQSFETPSCLSGMTIHKSKGLEAPFVYLFDINGGIATYPQYMKGFGYSIFSDLIDIKNDLMKLVYNKECNKEKLRLIYVALTRAQESLTILIDGKKSGPALNLYKYNDLASLLLLDYEPENVIEIDYETFMNEKEDFMDKFVNISEVDNDSKETIEKPQYVDLMVNPMDVIERRHASHELYEIDDEIKKLLEKGTLLHSYFEIVDFLKPDLRMELELKGVPKQYQKYLFNFKQLDIFDNKCIRELHEHPYFEDGVNGIIDYVLEKEDELLIIDFKTKNIDDPGYISQLNTYRRYLETKTTKPIRMYLYSIIDNILKEVEEV